MFDIDACSSDCNLQVKDMLLQNKTLSHFSLSNSGNSPFGKNAIFEGLAENTTMKTIELCNCLTKEEKQFICDNFHKKNYTLTRFTFDGFLAVGLVSFDCLSEALARNRIIEWNDQMEYCLFGYCLGMHGLALPIYVLLEIVDWFSSEHIYGHTTLMYENKSLMHLVAHKKKFCFMRSVLHSFLSVAERKVIKE